MLWCGSANQIARNDNGICGRQRYFTKVNKQSCGKMPETTTLSKCAMQSFFGQFHRFKNFFVENRSFSQMLPLRFSISGLVRRKSKLRGGAFPGYQPTHYDTQVVWTDEETARKRRLKIYWNTSDAIPIWLKPMLSFRKAIWMHMLLILSSSLLWFGLLHPFKMKIAILSSMARPCLPWFSSSLIKICFYNTVFNATETNIWKCFSTTFFLI